MKLWNWLRGRGNRRRQNTIGARVYYHKCRLADEAIRQIAELAVNQYERDEGAILIEKALRKEEK